MLPLSGTVRCYSFKELFAEKLRAMGQRGRPRDLYDIVNLFRRNDLIEPYSLRRTREGNLVLHALRPDDRQHRSCRGDRMEHVEVTPRPFRPIYTIEFSASGPMAALPARGGSIGTTRMSMPRHPRASSGLAYIIQCPICQKQSRRQTRGISLRPHKATGGWSCPGRRGYLVGTR